MGISRDGGTVRAVTRLAPSPFIIAADDVDRPDTCLQRLGCPVSAGGCSGSRAGETESDGVTCRRRRWITAACRPNGPVRRRRTDHGRDPSSSAQPRTSTGHSRGTRLPGGRDCVRGGSGHGRRRGRSTRGRQSASRYPRGTSQPARGVCRADPSLRRHGVRELGTWAYRFVHLLLTGERVRVGNFSVIPRDLLRRLVAVSDLWNHYAAAVFHARIPYTTIPTTRGTRYAGASQMNFVALVTHGLSAMSVFGDRIGVRLLIVTCALAGLILSAAGALLVWHAGGWRDASCVDCPGRTGGAPPLPSVCHLVGVRVHHSRRTRKPGISPVS